jgi:hypothetical protein
MKIEGGCLCGKVRYSADAEPTFVGVCHCKNCQKGTGTAFAVVVALPKAQLNVDGPLKSSAIAPTAAKHCIGVSARNADPR